MLRLEKRPTPSRAWAWGTPLLAVVLTMIAGGILFAMLGKDPLVAIRTIFWEPVSYTHLDVYKRQVLTFSHALDLELCHRLLGHGFSRLGLIGSETKWARFRSRLAALGHPAKRIGCLLYTSRCV